MNNYIGIHCLDNAEDNAMLQALYSRSNTSVTEHIKKVKGTGSGNFMARYYVGYGHKSIGDCGSTTIFIEGVTHLVAKAFQDNHMYSGQECSTRYMDYSKARLHNPAGIFEVPKYPNLFKKGQTILDEWMKIYTEYTAFLYLQVKNEHPNTELANETIYNNSIKARVFDIMRGFLPVSSTTNLSWHTNLRQARTKLRQLKFHPLIEVRKIANEVHKQLLARYPNSFKYDDMVIDLNNEKDMYYKVMDQKIHYAELNPPNYDNSQTINDDYSMSFDHNFKLTDYNERLFYNRPKGAELPDIEAGSCNMLFKLDFGSFRDLQRHRNGVCKIPMIEHTSDLHRSYFDTIGKYLTDEEHEAFVGKVRRVLKEVEEMHTELYMTDSYDCANLLIQYYMPMATEVNVELNYSLQQMIYVSELRSQKNVHFSLRPIAMAMGNIVKNYDPNIKVHTDYEKSNWDINRGTQTISEK